MNGVGRALRAGGVWCLRELAKMRTAIGLLALAAVASLLGTLVPQGLAVQAYVPAWGPWGAKVLVATGLTDVFRAWWFVGLMGVLMLSVATCLARNGGHIWGQIWVPKRVPEGLARQVVVAGLTAAGAQAAGWRVVRRWESGVVLWGRLGWADGRWNRLGYWLVHGGVLGVAAAGLASGLWGWRGSLNLREGETDRMVLVWRAETPSARQLPFDVTNRSFVIEHFPSGMPSRYATELTLQKPGQAPVEQVVEVNRPVSFGGYTFYQASFGDGGTLLRNVMGVRLADGAVRVVAEARMYERVALPDGSRVELLDFRPHTVESLGAEGRRGAVRDVGPSLDYLVQPPDAPARQLRAYLSHPDWVGVADGQQVGGQNDGQVIYRPVWLGVSQRDAQLWPVVAQVVREPEVFQRAMRPLLARETDPQRRVALGLAVLRAAAVVRELELTHLLLPQEFELRRYSGLMVARDPGAVWFWPSALALLLGVVLMLGRRLVWLWQVPGAGGQSAFYLTSPHGRGVAEEVGRELTEGPERKVV